MVFPLHFKGSVNLGTPPPKPWMTRPTPCLSCLNLGYRLPYPLFSCSTHLLSVPGAHTSPLWLRAFTHTLHLSLQVFAQMPSPQRGLLSPIYEIVYLLLHWVLSFIAFMKICNHILSICLCALLSFLPHWPGAQGGSAQAYFLHLFISLTEWKAGAFQTSAPYLCPPHASTQGC